MTNIFSRGSFVAIDNHTHSHHSFDSSMQMDKAAEMVLKGSLGGICFSDHYDFDAPPGIKLFTFDVDKQQEEIDALKERYPSIILLKGVEIGIQPVSMDQIRQFMAGHSFDTVIASMHFVRGTDPFHGTFYEGLDPKRAYNIYLEDILYCISDFKDFDILGHFDYVARYAPYDEHEISMKHYGDLLEPILSILAENGKTFEINTKTYQRFRYGTPTLDTGVLKRFRELGGEAVSLGSDAHKAEKIGEQFPYYTEVLKQCGYRYGVFYRNRKPEYYKIG
ncbi:MAG TPA: histidinol-phosphatase HisJ family protein [Bacteroidales bacterium]|nr:MAG: Histidinol-phosphatase [Bacteroidetes bacterium ADurb.Bin037]HPV88080.1 histidinol-phosphatase HisJ family protein [Bacteroidales bacterium]HPW78966.1 histidinol-phosphatase HisJ family protein [Bacteroidales bacterium]HQB56489.1 histidinol-phosphatase HisJ family protein [Bacteroidales bacterium]